MDFEHLIKRKRRRQSVVDPCLGFYPPVEPSPAPSSPPIQEPPEISAASKSRTYARQRPRIEPETEQDMSPPPKRIRKRPNPLRIDSPPPEKSHSHTRPRKLNRKQGRRPLAKRLLHAAVLSGVDPVDSLIEPDPDAPLPTRRPLQFQTHDPESTPPSSKRRHTSSMRSASFISRKEMETLLPRENYKPLTRWPSRPNLAKKSNSKNRKHDSGSAPVKNSKNSSFGSSIDTRRPLTFVPIQKSDLLLSHRNPGSATQARESPTPATTTTGPAKNRAIDNPRSKHKRNPSKLTLIPLFPTSRLMSKPVSTTIPPSLAEKNPLVPGQCQSISPTIARGSIPIHIDSANKIMDPRIAIEQQTQIISPYASSSDPDNDSHSNAPASAPIVFAPSTSAPISSPITSMSVQDTHTHTAFASAGMHSMTPVDFGLSSPIPSLSFKGFTNSVDPVISEKEKQNPLGLNPDSVENNHSQNTSILHLNHPPSTVTATSSKTSANKPLSSFFDEFLETVRAATATQTQASVADRGWIRGGNVNPKPNTSHKIQTRPTSSRSHSSASRSRFNPAYRHQHQDVHERANTGDSSIEGYEYVFDEWSTRGAQLADGELDNRIEMQGKRGEEGSGWLTSNPNLRVGPTPSPDLLVAFRPSQYQVTLSDPLTPAQDPEPTNISNVSREGALRSAMAGLKAFYG